MTNDCRLLAWLIACFYALFTLIPDSHSLMVKWSWVAIWQIGLLFPVLWLLWFLWQQRRIQPLGNGLDWFIGVVIVGLIVSIIWAEFPNQARWYGWSVLCFIAALYALNCWLNYPQRRYQLLVAQGYLNLAFILISLSLWTTQTLLPELTRLNAFRQYGVNLSFDFSVLELRNWAPLGHQNYVAGYLLLALPLLLGLSILEAGWRRWIWLIGIGLGLVDLYTTSSRGGWLGLIILCLVGFGILIFRSRIPRFWLLLGGISFFTSILLLILANNRLRTLIMAVFSGQGGGELAYRMINATIGWRMGSSHPWTGIGLGGVPLLYQKYRPIWAGQESELAYQLHSTPAQLWAEMGLWGILAALGAIAWLIYLFWGWLVQNCTNSQDNMIVWSIFGSLFAYGVISLTDYQLDNISISGTLVIYLACLASIFRAEQPQTVINPLKKHKSRIFLLFVATFTFLVIIWLVPIHRAWQLSSQGFRLLEEDNIEEFVERLTEAHDLATWEPYYPYQLGWNLGNLSLKTGNPPEKQHFLDEGIHWLHQGITNSPYQEFGYSNLGWLLLKNNPGDATYAFAHSVQLIPAKRGVMYGLGLSLLTQEQVDWGIEALALEGLRNPLFITSPIWRIPSLKSIYPQVTNRIIARYTELLQQNTGTEAFNSYLHLCRGSLHWWLGNFSAAHRDLDTYGTILSQVMLELTEDKSPQKLSQLPPSSPAALVIQAWFNPTQRSILLQQAWIRATQTALLPEEKQALLTSMERSRSFEDWLKRNAPVLQYRHERSGFGVLSRHIDGPLPTDFLIIVDNLAMSNWFADLFPSTIYDPELDLALQPQRDKLLETFQMKTL